METSPDMTIPQISPTHETSRFRRGSQVSGDAFSLIEVIIAMGDESHLPGSYRSSERLALSRCLKNWEEGHGNCPYKNGISGGGGKNEARNSMHSVPFAIIV